MYSTQYLCILVHINVWSASKCLKSFQVICKLQYLTWKMVCNLYLRRFKLYVCKLGNVNDFVHPAHFMRKMCRLFKSLRAYKHWLQFFLWIKFLIYFFTVEKWNQLFAFRDHIIIYLFTADISFTELFCWTIQLWKCAC